MEAKTGISVFECKRAGIKTEKRRRASHVERNRRSQHVCVSLYIYVSAYPYLYLSLLLYRVCVFCVSLNPRGGKPPGMTAGAGSPGSPLTPIGHAPSFDTGVAALTSRRGCSRQVIQ